MGELMRPVRELGGPRMQLGGPSKGVFKGEHQRELVESQRELSVPLKLLRGRRG